MWRQPVSNMSAVWTCFSIFDSVFTSNENRLFSVNDFNLISKAEKLLFIKKKLPLYLKK